MKKILISVMMCLSLSACAGHNAESPVVTPPVWDPQVAPNNSPVSANQVITGDNWSVTIPGNWQKVPSDDEPAIKLSYGNPDTKTLVILDVEPFQGKIEDFAQATGASIIQQGGSLLGSNKVNINNQDYYLLVGVKSSATLWGWVTIKNGTAYGLICGGPAGSAVSEESCNFIANSFKIQ
jgi:hypothetical protein